MSQEIEAVALDALAQPHAAKHGAALGSPCANCATRLQGPWCHHCGQSSADYHRSAWHLSVEFFEGLFHFDGRLWHTLPDLIVRPARLTRAYISGHRAPQVPPLRMFLVTLLLLFLAGSLGSESTEIQVLKGDSAQQARQHLDQIHVELANHRIPSAEAWLRGHLARAMERPEEFLLIIEGWSERFAILMLPLAAALLSLIFIFQRRFWLFDHTVFAMHSLSFVGLLVTGFILLGRVLPDGWSAALLLAAPVHLFMHLRGVYGGSVVATLLRMTLLGSASLIGMVFLLLGLVSVGLMEMKG
jgi:hypothetical protein